jgi:hypothetical protein
MAKRVTNLGAFATAVAVAFGAALLRPRGESRAASSTPMTLSALEDRFKSQVQPVLQKHCYGCHANGKHKGDVSLDKYADLLAVQSDRDTWQSVCDQVSGGDMPPEEKPRPTSTEIALLTSWVKDALTFRDRTSPRDPGRVTIRRLNRAEYNNTIRDLVGVDFKPANDFPGDDTGYGFDNIADVLSMSPLLAEKYLDAAEQIMDRAIVTEPPKPQVTRYDASNFNKINGGGTKPKSDGAWTLTANGELYVTHDAPGMGEYDIRVHAYGVKLGQEFPRMSIRVDNETLRAVDVRGTMDKPEVVGVAAHLRPGPHRISVAFVNEFINRSAKGDRPPARKLTVEQIEVEGPKLPPNAPLPPPTAVQKKLLFVTPSSGGNDVECARQDIGMFAARAYRRPISDDDLTRLLALYQQSRNDGEKFDKAVKTAMVAVLCSPQFLFRIERPNRASAEKIQRIDDYSLASRLSYFLWSSMPDDTLFNLADAGKLHEKQVLEAQVRRMLADSKADAFVANFAGQWLELRLLDDYEADTNNFPNWSRELRADMKMEAETFFRSLIKDDASVLNIIDSNYTFLDERLANFYGIPDVTGPNFRKVNLAPAYHRGGVLTMAGVLTVTAMPARTSPVKRGKYILEQILGTPPPPPPPDVPALKEKKTDAASASLRQRMEQHRSDPTCASCHKRMDPIGFALENYNAIGHWRTTDGNFPIDASGVLPGNKKVDGPAGLKKVILDRKDDFVRCLVGKMLTYAVGRGIEPTDRPIIEDVCDRVRENDYKFSSLMLGIVESDAFMKRRKE